MNRFQSSSLAVALVAGLLMASGVAAFVLLDPPRTWDSAAQYIVDQNGSASVTDGDGGVSDVVSAINSNQAWNGAGSGSVVNARSGNTNGFSLGDGVPMLRFDDPVRVCNGSCLAATFTGYYSQRNDGTWRINDADIVTNTRYDFTTPSEPDGCSSEFFIDGIMVHEIGHGLGLGHSNVSGATMFPSVSSCNNGPATIETDDANGLNALYGNGGGGGGGGGGGCTLGQKGDSCTVDGDCCSNKCRGRSGAKTCK
jgi:hypothetical protein